MPVIKSPGYETAKATVLSSSTAALAREQVATGIKNAEGFIDAAATGKPFVTPRGTLYVTDELVSKTIAGIDASFCRFRQLGNPTWNPQVEERKYADVHVRILSDCPFRREFRDLTVESGKKTRVTMLSYAISEKDQLGVDFLAVDGQFAIREVSMAHIARAALREMGINGIEPITSNWRGAGSSGSSGHRRFNTCQQSRKCQYLLGFSHFSYRHSVVGLHAPVNSNPLGGSLG
jgi:hypothetical protein